MNKTKILINYFDLENNLSFESLWADKINEDEYQLKNIPFFAPSLSYDDVVFVEKEDGKLFLLDIVEESGNSTIQVVFFKEDKIIEVIKQLGFLNCGWEGMNNQKYIAINIPKNISYIKVKSFLDSMFNENILDYNESNLSKVHYFEINN